MRAAPQRDLHRFGTCCEAASTNRFERLSRAFDVLFDADMRIVVPPISSRVDYDVWVTNAGGMMHASASI